MENLGAAHSGGEGSVAVTATRPSSLRPDRRRPAIVALASNEWQTPWWMARQHLYSRLAARGWPIIYTTGPQDIWLRNEPKWQSSSWLSRLNRVDVDATAAAAQNAIWLDRPGKLLPRYRRLPVLDQIAARRFGKRLGAAARSVSRDDLIAHVWHPKFWPFVPYLGARHLVFHIHDAYDLGPGWCKEWEVGLRELAQRADLIITVADHMASRLPDKAGARAKILPHGVDVQAVIAGAEMRCPEDLERIPKPRIGYVGRVNPKIDFEGIAEVAKRRPDWNWVFVGAVGIGAANTFEQSPRHEAGFERVRQCRNVHFLGVKDRKEVPAYLNHMDVNVLYYSGWGTTGHPTKLYEYFAAGKPIVATSYEGVSRFSRVIDLVTSPAEWVEAIKTALATGGVGTVAERQALALESTWDKRCDQLESWLLEITNRPSA